MSRLVAGKKSKMGRPRVDTEEVCARLDRALLDGLDAWAEREGQSKPSRSDGIRIALKEWLTGLGLLKAGKNVSPNAAEEVKTRLDATEGQ